MNDKSIRFISKSCVAIFSFSLLVIFTQSCAPVPKRDMFAFGAKDSITRHKVPKTVETKIQNVDIGSENVAYIRIRFPVGIDENALKHFSVKRHEMLVEEDSLYVKLRKPYPNNFGPNAIAVRMHDEISKSAYYAMEWYAHLIKDIPKEKIVLDAYFIEFDEIRNEIRGGRNEFALPALLEVDFSIERHDYVDFVNDVMMLYRNTMGNWVVPEVTVAYLNFPYGRQVLLSTGWPAADDKFWGFHCTNCKWGYEHKYRTKLPGVVPGNPDPFDARGGDSAIVPMSNAEIVVGKFLLNKFEKVESGSVDQAKQYYQFLNNFMIGALAMKSSYSESDKDVYNYLKYFEDNSKEIFRSAENDSSDIIDRSKVQILKKFMKTELDYMSQRSYLNFNNYYYGSAGEAMRRQLESEQAVINSLKEAYNKAKANKYASWLSSSIQLFGAYKTSSHNLDSALSMSQDGVVNLFESDRHMIEARNFFHDTSSSFSVKMEGLSTASIEVTGLELIEEDSFRSLGELRAKMFGIYKRLFY